MDAVARQQAHYYKQLGLHTVQQWNDAFADAQDQAETHTPYFYAQQNAAGQFSHITARNLGLTDDVLTALITKHGQTLVLLELVGNVFAQISITANTPLPLLNVLDVSHNQTPLTLTIDVVLPALAGLYAHAACLQQLHIVQHCPRLDQLLISGKTNVITDMLLHPDFFERTQWPLQVVYADSTLPSGLLGYFQGDTYDADKLAVYFAERLQNQQANTTEQVHHCKLILVGNTDAGKTSLFNVLTGSNKEGDSTHGINIKYCDYTPKAQNTRYAFTVLDYGGQDYYHNTHLPFYSSNSVYVVCYGHGQYVHFKSVIKRDGIDEKGYPLHYWLQSIDHIHTHQHNLQLKPVAFFDEALQASTQTTEETLTAPSTKNTPNAITPLDATLAHVHVWHNPNYDESTKEATSLAALYTVLSQHKKTLNINSADWHQQQHLCFKNLRNTEKKAIKGRVQGWLNAFFKDKQPATYTALGLQLKKALATAEGWLWNDATLTDLVLETTKEKTTHDSHILQNRIAGIKPELYADLCLYQETLYAEQWATQKVWLAEKIVNTNEQDAINCVEQPCHPHWLDALKACGGVLPPHDAVKQNAVNPNPCYITVQVADLEVDENTLYQWLYQIQLFKALQQPIETERQEALQANLPAWCNVTLTNKNDWKQLASRDNIPLRQYARASADTTLQRQIDYLDNELHNAETESRKQALTHFRQLQNVLGDLVQKVRCDITQQDIQVLDNYVVSRLDHLTGYIYALLAHPNKATETSQAKPTEPTHNTLPQGYFDANALAKVKLDGKELSDVEQQYVLAFMLYHKIVFKSGDPNSKAYIAPHYLRDSYTASEVLLFQAFKPAFVEYRFTGFYHPSVFVDVLVQFKDYLQQSANNKGEYHYELWRNKAILCQTKQNKPLNEKKIKQNDQVEEYQNEQVFEAVQPLLLLEFDHGTVFKPQAKQKEQGNAQPLDLPTEDYEKFRQPCIRLREFVPPNNQGVGDAFKRRVMSYIEHRIATYSFETWMRAPFGSTDFVPKACLEACLHNRDGQPTDTFSYNDQLYRRADFKLFMGLQHTHNMAMRRMFISYSKEDLADLKTFETYLQPLKRQGLIATWNCSELMAGDAWDATIQQHFDEADIYCLLVSPHSMANDYVVRKELQKARQRYTKEKYLHYRIIPVLLDYADWRDIPELGQFQGIPYKGFPIKAIPQHNRAWHVVIEQLKRLIHRVNAIDDENVHNEMYASFLELMHKKV